LECSSDISEGGGIKREIGGVTKAIQDGSMIRYHRYILNQHPIRKQVPIPIVIKYTYVCSYQNKEKQNRMNKHPSISIHLSHTHTHTKKKKKKKKKAHTSKRKGKVSDGDIGQNDGCQAIHVDDRVRRQCRAVRVHKVGDDQVPNKHKQKL
jgi:hypothetical protein